MADQPVQVRFGGLGGQGLVTLGAVLAEAGAASGLRVAASQAYGSRARGGATRADVILSAEEIDFPHVHHPDLMVVLAQEAHDLFAADLRAGGLILADSFFVKARADEPDRFLAFDATGLALRDLGNRLAANFVMLGALLGCTDLVPRAAVEAALAALVRPRYQQVNLKALGLGWERGSSLRAEAGPWR